MRRFCSWIVISSIATAGCFVVGGYDFDGYYVDGGAGDAIADDAPAETGTGDGGPCTADLTADARNCGVCGHDCIRGVCAGSVCQPWTIVSGETAKPCPGGGCGPTSLAVIPGALFWSFYAPSGGIFRSDLGDGGVQELAATASPYEVATDSKFIYWSDLASVRRCPVQSCGGTAPDPYEPGTYDYANGFAFAGSSIFWTDGTATDAGTGRIWSSDDGIVPTATAIVGGQRDPLGITIDGAAIYWTDQGTPPLYGDGSLMRADLDGTNARPLASAQKAPQWVKAYGGHVYWSNAGTAPNYFDGSIMTCDPAACDPTPIALAQGWPYEIAVDASGIYWTTTVAAADAGAAATLPIMRCSPSAPGCTPTPIATGTAPWALVTDDKAIYWTDIGSGTVMGLAK